MDLSDSAAGITPIGGSKRRTRVESSPEWLGGERDRGTVRFEVPTKNGCPRSSLSLELIFNIESLRRRYLASIVRSDQSGGI
jgi:hypothetical protein